MPEEKDGHLTIEIDPRRLTERQIKAIGESIVAELTKAAAAARGGAAPTVVEVRAEHEKSMTGFTKHLKGGA